MKEESKSSNLFLPSFEIVIPTHVVATAFVYTLTVWIRCALVLECVIRRDHYRMISKTAVDRHNHYLWYLGGRSTVSVANGTCEEAISNHVLVPGRSVVKHHTEGTQGSQTLQRSTFSELPDQDASWSLICRERVHFGDEENKFTSPCLKLDVPISFVHNFLQGKRKSIYQLNGWESLFVIFQSSLEAKPSICSEVDVRSFLFLTLWS